VTSWTFFFPPLFFCEACLFFSGPPISWPPPPRPPLKCAGSLFLLPAGLSSHPLLCPLPLSAHVYFPWLSGFFFPLAALFFSFSLHLTVFFLFFFLCYNWGVNPLSAAFARILNFLPLGRFAALLGFSRVILVHPRARLTLVPRCWFRSDPFPVLFSGLFVTVPIGPISSLSPSFLLRPSTVLSRGTWPVARNAGPALPSCFFFSGPNPSLFWFPSPGVVRRFFRC